jgi:hypothetical protein
MLSKKPCTMHSKAEWVFRKCRTLTRGVHCWSLPAQFSGFPYLLECDPDPLGPQHDEREPGYLGGRIKWKERLREVLPEAILHSSVYERFAAEAVQHFYERKPYRPLNLANHAKLLAYYQQAGPATPPGSQAGSR